jgi:hypothetical protein
MDNEIIIKILDFFFYDREFKGDTTELWTTVINLVKDIIGKITGA